MVLTIGNTIWEMDARLFHIRQKCSEIFPFLAREIGDYTNHGEKHSKGIESGIEAIKSFFKIDPFDEYLLRACAWLHDIGYIRGIKEHYKNTSDLIKEHADKLGIYGNEMLDLCWICISHEKEYDINDVPPEDGRIKLRFLAALFRMLDACDVMCHRAPEIVFELIKDALPELSVDHWIANQAIRNIVFDHEKKEIVVRVNKDHLDEAKIALDLIEGKINSVRDQLKGKFPCIDLKIEPFPSPP